MPARSLPAFTKDAELVAIFGRRGSGKSTVAKALVKDRRRLIAFDPNGEYSGRGWTQTASREAVKRGMISGWRRGFKIAYVPPPGGEIEALHWLSTMAWAAQGPYASGIDPQKLTLLLEEAHTGLPVTALPRDFSGIVSVIRQGRHMGIEVIAVTQRPAALNADFRGNAARTYIFPLAAAIDQAEVLRLIGAEHKDRLRTLESFHFLLAQDGRVTPGAVQKSGAVKLASGKNPVT